MPKLSPTMEEGQISRWLKEEGDEIEANETIAEVDTDKATMEMTSLEPGTLLKIIVPGGENAKLGQTIGIIGEKGEDFSALLKKSKAKVLQTARRQKQEKPKKSKKKFRHAEKPNEVAKEGKRRIKQKKLQKPQDAVMTRSVRAQKQTRKNANRNEPNGNGRMIVSPIAARMAAENSIDLKSI